VVRVRQEAEQEHQIGAPVFDDRARWQFTASGLNDLWLTNVTEHRTREGRLYMRAVKDKFSNRIIGNSISDRMHSSLAVTAIDNAVARRRDVSGCVVYSDRSGQGGFNWSPQHLNLEVSCGSSSASSGSGGAAGDNAALESFVALVQRNVVNRQTWDPRDDLRIAIVTWIERTYHRRRRQGEGDAGERL